MPDFDHSVLGTRQQISLGLDTFGDAPLDGAPGNHAETLREVVAEAVLADRVGVDYIGLGEHHRADYAVSAPDVVLAAIAGQTERIRLGTGVTVLSSDDPIRVYQRFATLDAVSSGRAEVQLGRGSFIESFGLFGLDLGDYDRLFAEKLDLFSALQHEQPVTWQGSIRAPLEGKLFALWQQVRRPEHAPFAGSLAFWGAMVLQGVGLHSSGEVTLIYGFATDAQPDGAFIATVHADAVRDVEYIE